MLYRKPLKLLKRCFTLVIIALLLLGLFTEFRLLQYMTLTKEDTIDISRNSANRFWQAEIWLKHSYVNTKSTMYAHRFFYDDREKHGYRTKIIGIISSTLPSDDFDLFCTIWARKSSQQVAQISVEAATLTQTRHNRYFSQGQEYLTYILSCDSALVVPNFISLSTKKWTPLRHIKVENVTAPFLIPVVLPIEDESEKKAIGICTYGMHGEFQDEDIPNFIQWVELSHMFGASFISLYNLTLAKYSKYFTRVVSYYIQKGMLEFIQFPIIPHSSQPYHSEWQSDMIKDAGTRHVVGDCMYRQLHKYWYILFVDWGQIVVPSGDCGNYIHCISFLENNSTKSSSSGFVVKHRENKTENSKSSVFLNPQVCNYLYEDCFDQKSSSVPLDVMSSFHYKHTCGHCDLRHDNNATFKGYKEMLVEKMKGVLQAVKLN